MILCGYLWGRQLDYMVVRLTDGLFYCRRGRLMNWTFEPEPIEGRTNHAGLSRQGIIQNRLGTTHFKFMIEKHKKTVLILNSLENLENCLIY